MGKVKRTSTDEEKFVKAVLRGKDLEASKHLKKIVQRKAAAKIAKTLDV